MTPYPVSRAPLGGAALPARLVLLGLRPVDVALARVLGLRARPLPSPAPPRAPCHRLRCRARPTPARDAPPCPSIEYTACEADATARAPPARAPWPRPPPPPGMREVVVAPGVGQGRVVVVNRDRGLDLGQGALLRRRPGSPCSSSSACSSSDVSSELLLATCLPPATLGGRC